MLPISDDNPTLRTPVVTYALLAALFLVFVLGLLFPAAVAIVPLFILVTLLLAPFGAFALNLSAITAAICMVPQAHTDPARRYTAAASCGAIYVVIGLFGAAVIGVLTAFPQTLVAAIAGLALLGTIGGALKAALEVEA